MLENEILNILRDPTVTMEEQAAMLAAMMRKRSISVYKYVKQQAQETIAKEREQYQDRIDRAYDDGLKNGYHMGLNDGEALAQGVDNDIAF